MNTQRIGGGFIIKPRAIQNSAIMRQPPHTREIFDYLCLNANHSDQVYNGNLVKRGQLFRRYSDIRDDLCWYVGWRKERYSENQMKKAMKFLRETVMIETKKELGGVLVTICEYDRYQTPKNYERTKESPNERTNEEPLLNQTLSHTNKNDNKANNERMEEGTDHSAVNEVYLHYLNLHGKPLSPSPSSFVYKKIKELIRRYEDDPEKVKKLIDSYFSFREAGKAKELSPSNFFQFEAESWPEPYNNSGGKESLLTRMKELQNEKL